MLSTVARTVAFAMVALAGVGAPGTCRAELVFTLDAPINGTAPVGTLSATFKTVTTGEVTLTLDTHGLVASEYVASWGFNVDPAFRAPLTIVRTGGTAPSDALDFQVIGSNVTNLGSQTKAGLFDIGFFFESSNAKRFKFDQTIVFKIMGARLTEDVFNVNSAGDCERPGGYRSAADVRAIPHGGGSGSIGATGGVAAVPEPGSLLLAGIGLGSVGLYRRIKGRKAPG